MTVLYIIIAIIAVILIYVLATYNQLVKLRNIVKEAFSTMDVYLKKRWDLIPNLVEVVKGYASHETNAFETVTKLRTAAYDSLSTDEKMRVNEELSNAVPKIMAVAEQYPELKANANFLDLNKQLAGIEDEIANARKYYNGSVRIYNNKIQMVPSNIVASIFKFEEQKMFEADAEERNSVKIDMN
jgi:LemA protein